MRRILEIALTFSLLFLAHFIFFRVSPALLDSDMGWNLIESERFLRGEWPMYYYGLWYSGTTLGFFRAIWVFLVEAMNVRLFSFDSYLTGHLSFSYMVLPALMTAATVILVRSYASRTTTFLVGLFAAFGFHSWIVRYGLDWYYATFILGCCLLSLRGRTLNPWKELSLTKLFLAAALSGLALYTGRFSLIYLVAFWLPWEAVWQEAKKLWVRKKNLDFVFKYTIGFFIFLFCILEVFGTTVGFYKNKPIKLHSTPNLQIAFVFALIWWLKYYPRKNWTKIFSKRLWIVAVGFCLGFIREIYFFFFENNFHIPPQLWGTNSLAEVFQVLTKLPRAWAENVSGPGIGATMNGLVFAAVFFFLFFKSRKHPPFRIFSVIAFLSILAFLRVRTHLVGHEKYLFPIFPAILVSLGCFFDFCIKSKRIWLVGGVCALFFINQVSGRAMLKDSLRSSDKFQNIIKIIQVFESHNIQSAFSPDYHFSNQLSLVSSKKILFLNSELFPKEADERWKNLASSELAGFLFHEDTLNGRTHTQHGKTFKLTWLGRERFWTLYKGQVEPLKE